MPAVISQLLRGGILTCRVVFIRCEPNDLMPADFSLRCDDAATAAPSGDGSASASGVPPRLLGGAGVADGTRLLHKMDARWRVPKVSVASHRSVAV